MASRINEKEYNKIKRLLKRYTYTKIIAESGRSYQLIKRIERSLDWQDFKDPITIPIKRGILARIKNLLGR